MSLDESVITDSLPDTDPSSEADRRWLWAALAIVVGPTLAGGLAVIVSTPWIPVSDNALISLTARDVFSVHPPLLGVYSRFGFHHPGPALAYWLAPWQTVFGPRGMLVGALVLNVMILVAMVWLLWRRGGATLAVTGALMLLVLVRAMGGDAVSPWNPWMVTLSVGLVVVAAWSVWRRDWWALPVLVVAATWSMQAHIGSALPVAAMLGVGLVALVLGFRAGDRPSGTVVAITVVLGVLGWLGPMLDLVRNDPNNVSLILDAFRHPTESSVGWATAAGVTARDVGITSGWISGATFRNIFSGEVSSATLWSLAPLVIAMVVSLVVAWRRRDRPARSLLVILGVALLAGYVAIARITGPALPYLFRWTWTLTALSWLAIGWTMARALAPKVASMRWWPRRTAVGAALTVVLVAVLAPLIVSSLASATLQDEAVSDAVMAVAPDAAAQLQGSGPVLVTNEGEAWAVHQSGLIAELRRRGVDARFLNGDFSGQRWAIGADTPAHEVRVSMYESRTERRKRGETPWLTFEPRSDAEQGEYESLRIRVAAAWLALAAGEPVIDPISAAEQARLDELEALGDPMDLYLDAP